MGAWWRTAHGLGTGFRRFWAAAVVSTLGDHVLATALAFRVLVQSGSLLGLGSLLIAQALPRVVLGSWAGVLADRWDRRRVLIASDVGRGLVVLVLLAVNVSHALVLVDAVLMAEGFLSVVFQAERARVLPALVPDGLLQAANAYLGAGLSAARVVGPALGGLLLVAVGLHAAVLADVVSYGGSAALLAGLAMRFPSEGGTERRPALWEAWRAGVRPLWREPWLRWMLLMLVLVLVADGSLSPGWAGFVVQVLHQNAAGYGLLGSVAGIGGVVGGLGVGAASRRVRPTKMLTGSLWLAALVLGPLVVWARPLALVMVGYTALQVPLAGFGASVATVMQQRIPDAMRGRIFGALASAQSTALIGGILLMGAVAPHVGIVAGLVGAAGLLVLAGAAALLAGISAEADAARPTRYDAARDETPGVG